MHPFKCNIVCLTVCQMLLLSVAGQSATRGGKVPGRDGGGQFCGLLIGWEIRGAVYLSFLLGETINFITKIYTNY